MKKVFNILSLFLVILALAACEYATIIPDTPSPDVPVSFKTEIQPYFTANCVKCHTNGGPMPNLIEGKAYQSLISNTLVIAGDAANSKLYTEIITGGGMAGFSDAKSNGLVKNWINQGAKDN